MASRLNHKPGDWNMMSRLKKFRWTFLAAALSLAATTTADNLKYDKLDWDDDLVPNAQELIDGTSSLDPLKASCTASRALVLGAVKAAGVTLPVPQRFQVTNSFTLEFWYSPVADASGKANGTLFSLTDGSGDYTIKVENSIVKADSGSVALAAPFLPFAAFASMMSAQI